MGQHLHARACASAGRGGESGINSSGADDGGAGGWESWTKSPADGGGGRQKADNVARRICVSNVVIFLDGMYR